MRFSRVVITAAVGVVLAGCGGASSTTADGASGDQSKKIGRADTADWPLTVESGVLKCEGSGGFGKVTIEVDGKSYALNGSAMSDKSNVDLRPIWADDKAAGFKMSVGPLIQEGLRLCK